MLEIKPLCTYLSDLLSRTAKVYERDINEVRSMDNSDSFVFKGPLRPNEDHVPNLLVLLTKHY